MHHAIIGLSQIGASCLTRIYKLFSDSFPGESLHVNMSLFYFRVHDDAVNQLPFISQDQCFKLREESIELAKEKNKQLFYKEIEFNQKDDMSFFEKNRRFYSIHFQLDRIFLQNLLQQHMKDIRESQFIFHVIVDGSQACDSGVLPDVLIMLEQQYKDAKVFLYIFYPEQGLFGYQAASLYMTILECKSVINNHVCFYNFPFSKNNLIIKEQNCASHIFHSVIINDLSIEKNSDHDKKISSEIMCLKRQFVVSVDRQKVRSFFARQIALKILEQLVSNKNNQENLIMPDWITRLFIDKKWLLHRDFLFMNQGFPGNKIENNYDPVEREWESRTQFILEGIDNGLEWRDQVSKISISLEDIYRKQFRGKGVHLFYAFNESVIASLAQEIVSLIDKELMKLWVKGDYKIDEVSMICNNIIIYINDQYNEIHRYRQQQRDFSLDLLHQHKNLINNWSRGKGFERRKIQKSRPIKEVAYQLMHYYISDCNVKAMTFACKLLLSVIQELNELKGRIMCLGESIIDEVNSIQYDYMKINCKVVLRSTDAEIWKLSGEGDFLALMPKSFFCTIANLYKKFQSDRKFFIKIPKRFSEDIKYREIIKSVDQISDWVMLNHPVFNPERFKVVENILYWHFISVYEIKIQDAVQKITDSKPLGKLNDTWFLPTSFNKKNSVRLAYSFHEKMPTCNTLIDVGMLFPCLIYQQAISTPIGDLNGLAEWSKEYDQLLFCENGAFNTLAICTQSKVPYPEYENLLLPIPEPDEIRSVLLLGEVNNIIFEKKINNNQSSVFLQLGNTCVNLGKNFLDAKTNITPSKFKLLKHHLDNINSVLPIRQVRHILNIRLENIKGICLSDKKDIRQVGWKEVGEYTAWVRVGERLMSALL